ncbi:MULTISPECIES: hypothetical protein [unclassified Ensifer]|uniref:hypothetical protein n=1 Tax=unclassified Ensifer TaxID=2633371 RepID=UPI000B19BCD5|nr:MULTISPECIES: hypothetical protein [unclassified Ensifer]
MFLDNLKRFRADKRRRRAALWFSQVEEKRALMATSQFADEPERRRLAPLTIAARGVYRQAFTID